MEPSNLQSSRITWTWAFRGQFRTIGPYLLKAEYHEPFHLPTQTDSQMASYFRRAHREDRPNVLIENGTFIDIAGHQFNQVNIANASLLYNNVSVFDLLKDHVAFNAAFDSRERQLEETSVCQQGTRTQVLERISGWAEEDTQEHIICWLKGPAGSGKSAIAQTIAKQHADQNRLAFSFFFSRGKADRSDTRRLFPTFAYKLATSSRAFQRSLHDILANDMSILSSNLETQCQKLIIEPSEFIDTSSYMVVIDGLDECGDDLVLELVQLLVDTLHHGLQFRFLFTSRPEKYLVTFFNSPSISSKTVSLSLRDFDTDDDIRAFLQRHLGEIRNKQRDLMRGVPLPWPSQHDLDILVRKSEHLFIYVSTLVKFVGERNGLPQVKLQLALQLHQGLDPMYREILSLAADYTHFKMVLGTIIFLHEPLSVSHLAYLLHLQPHDIRLALQGCHSILMVPEADDGDTIRPYHASLRDFLTNANRSESQSLPSLDHNVNIVRHCMKVMSLNFGEHTSTPPPDHLHYACQYWLHHFALVITSGGSLGEIEVVSNPRVLGFIENCHQKWRKEWMHGLCTRERCGNAMEQCSNICDGLPVGQILEINAMIN